jgi:hypothetical protein
MDDRKLLGDTMNLDEEQIAFVSTLGTGEAVVYAEGQRKAVLVRVGLADVKRTGGRVSDSALTVSASSVRAETIRFPLRGCATCPSRTLHTSCAKDRASKQVTAAARAVVQSIRFGTADLSELHGLFTALCETESIRAACTLNEIAETFVLRIGRLKRWSVFDATLLLDDVLAATQGLASGDRGNDRPATERFASLERQSGPFDGCEKCGMPCRFRFDVPSDAIEGFSKAYMRSFSGPPEGFKVRWRDDVVIPVVRSMHSSLPTSDIRVANAAAYCFAVQKIPLVSRDAREVKNAIESFKDALA